MEQQKKNKNIVELDKFIEKKRAREKNSIYYEHREDDEKYEFMRLMLNEAVNEAIHELKAIDMEEHNLKINSENSIREEKEVILNDNKNCVVNCKELKNLNMKLSISIPKAILAYVIGSSMAFSIFTTIFVLTIAKGIEIMDLLTCLVFMIGTLGLLVTSIAAINDWRNFIKNV